MSVGIPMMIIQYKDGADNTAGHHKHNAVEIRSCGNIKQFVERITNIAHVSKLKPTTLRHHKKKCIQSKTDESIRFPLRLIPNVNRSITKKKKTLASAISNQDVNECLFSNSPSDPHDPLLLSSGHHCQSNNPGCNSGSVSRE